MLAGPGRASAGPSPPGLSLGPGFSRPLPKPARLRRGAAPGAPMAAVQGKPGKPAERPGPTVPDAARGSDPRPGCQVLSATGASGAARDAPAASRPPAPPCTSPLEGFGAVQQPHTGAHTASHRLAVTAAALPRWPGARVEAHLPAAARGKSRRVPAVDTGVTRATHHYAGVSCVTGNASSFKLSLEYRGLILTTQQRF